MRPSCAYNYDNDDGQAFERRLLLSIYADRFRNVRMFYLNACIYTIELRVLPNI